MFTAGMYLNAPELQPKFKSYPITRFQTTGQIGSAIVLTVKNSIPAARILARHIKGSRKAAAKMIFHLTKQTIPYKKEPSGNQTAKTLPRILNDAKISGGDCKHYTTMSASLCKALGIPVKMRLIGQNPFSRDFNHVYTVAIIDGQEFVIDPCMKAPGHEARYFNKKDVSL